MDGEATDLGRRVGHRFWTADPRAALSHKSGVRIGYTAAIEAKQTPAPDSAIKWDIINRFTNVLYDLTRRGIAEKIGHGPGARWKIAPRDPELL